MHHRFTTLLTVLFCAAVSFAQPATQPAADAGPAYPLGGRFESAATGISLRGPADCREVRRSGAEQIVQFVNDERKWSLMVSRSILGKAIPLDEWTDENGKKQPGVLEATIAQMRADTPGIEILRNDFVNVGNTEVGMIAGRVTVGLETRLTQRALVRATDRLYYSITFLTPAPRTGELETDPETVRVVDLFSRVIDSVEVLDQSRLVEQQNQRLFRTQALFVNLNEEKVRQSLVPEQWMRILREGKDVGYSYVVEEPATDLPRAAVGAGAGGAAGDQAGREGVRVGIRTRTYPEAGAQVDAETWFFVTFDRRNEVWSSVGLIANADNTKEEFGEFGSADRETRRVRDENLEEGERRADGSIDARQPPVRAKEVYSLQVLRNTRAMSGEQIERSLPPFYLPQALGHLLPRMIPLNEPKTYLFAAWVSDSREVMKRYVDVGSETYVTLAGKRQLAVPIEDRIGVEGSVTTHYMSPEGKYLGSVNTDSKITVLPADRATLEKIWSNPNLSRPGDVKTMPTRK